MTNIKGNKQKGICRECKRKYSYWRNKNNLCRHCQNETLKEKGKILLDLENEKI